MDVFEEHHLASSHRRSSTLLRLTEAVTISIMAVFANNKGMHQIHHNDAESLQVFLFQKAALYKCNMAGKPGVITRVVDTMTETPRPTRAEATDVANAVLDGEHYAGCEHTA